MKQIVILSGKGGTGKTFVSASLACLAENAVFADCDVDAANLHLLLAPEVRETHEFKGGRIAELNADACTGCGLCVEHCRFDALSMVPAQTAATAAGGSIDGPRTAVAEVDSVACEGCGVCGLVCPTDAFSYRTSDAGRWYISDTQYGPMVHAHLFAGEENSGKLVQQVRANARAVGEERQKDWVVIDGPPGTGCAVMSAMTGVDMVVLVTEPTVAGVHDVKRVMEVAMHFGIPVGMVINKSSINPEMAAGLRAFAAETKIRYLGDIPYDKRIVDSVADLKPYACNFNDDIADRLKSVWNNISAE
ncbi:MAG: ATP-binding protein [bacterium]